MALSPTLLAIALSLMSVSATGLPDVIQITEKGEENNSQISSETQHNHDQSLNDMDFQKNNDYDLDISFQEVSGDVLNCRSVTKVVQPYLFMKNLTELLVLDTEFLEQKIKVTECMPVANSDIAGETECFHYLGAGWKGSCKTKYTTSNLLVYNVQKNRKELITVDIPVSCYCSVS